MNAVTTIVLGQESSSGGGLFGLLLPLLLLGPLIYFMIVPQRKERQRHTTFLAGIDIGDAVVTSGGVHGTITFIEDDVVHLEVDTDVVIRVSKASLARLDTDQDAAEAESGGAGKEPDADET